MRKFFIEQTVIVSPAGRGILPGPAVLFLPIKCSRSPIKNRHSHPRDDCSPFFCCEYRGAVKRTLKVGDSWFENADTVHWFRNPSSTEAAEIWVVDLVPKKK